MLFDDTHFYISFRCWAANREAELVANDMRRDGTMVGEDYVAVFFDTFRDRRSGYMFVTNPLGAKLEQQVAEEGEGGFRGNNSANDWSCPVNPVVCPLP